MILVQGEARVHLDDLPVLRAAAAWLVPASRQDPGCQFYAFSEDMLEPGVINISQRWVDDAALMAHIATQHAARFGDVLRAIRLLDIRVTSYVGTDENVLMGG